MSDHLHDFEQEQFCYLTTIGRITGREHVVEIWFAVKDGTFYMLSGHGDRADWVKNASKEPRVTIRIGDRVLNASARAVDAHEEDALQHREPAEPPQALSDAGWLVASLEAAYRQRQAHWDCVHEKLRLDAQAPWSTRRCSPIRRSQNV